ncbi:hypothetical protein [Mesorhizobium amorphae]|jgi:hypothetical protein|uniref:hypothetical protein n=1 Tax=Mesorhizobium amorphae TaxID=71433 RepID=UPI003F4F6AB6
MALVEGFARDGFGASWRGFEISVRWTSCWEVSPSAYLVRPDKTLGPLLDGSWRLFIAKRRISGWTSVAKMVQI